VHDPDFATVIDINLIINQLAVQIIILLPHMRLAKINYIFSRFDDAPLTLIFAPKANNIMYYTTSTYISREKARLQY